MIVNQLFKPVIEGKILDSGGAHNVKGGIERHIGWFGDRDRMPDPLQSKAALA